MLYVRLGPTGKKGGQGTRIREPSEEFGERGLQDEDLPGFHAGTMVLTGVVV